MVKRTFFGGHDGDIYILIYCVCFL